MAHSPGFWGQEYFPKRGQRAAEQQHRGLGLRSSPSDRSTRWVDWSLWGCSPWPVAAKEWKDGQGTNFQPLFIPGPSLTGCPGALPELSITPGSHPTSAPEQLRCGHTDLPACRQALRWSWTPRRILSQPLEGSLLFWERSGRKPHCSRASFTCWDNEVPKCLQRLHFPLLTHDQQDSL